MFDIGWQEILLIGVIALVVVGPKDLPHVLRGAARLLAKARAVSREFQQGLAEIAREAELDDLRRKMEKAASFDPGEAMRNTVDPTGSLSAEFNADEFAQTLKRNVEAGPPKHAATPTETTNAAGVANSSALDGVNAAEQGNDAPSSGVMTPSEQHTSVDLSQHREQVSQDDTSPDPLSRVDAAAARTEREDEKHVAPADLINEREQQTKS